MTAQQYECGACGLRVTVASTNAQITCVGGHHLDDPRHKATTMRAVATLPYEKENSQ